MKVTVDFIGICAHINDQLPRVPTGLGPVQEPFGSAMRVVLPNVSLGLRVADHPVSPHVATLFIPAPFVAHAPAVINGLDPISAEIEGFWRMSGVQLELSNISEGLTLGQDYCLPSLTETAGVPLTLSAAVVDAGAAACVFTITGGTLSSFLFGEAVLGSLTAESDEPVLIVTRTWDQKVATIRLQQGMIDNVPRDPIIFVSNFGSEIDSSVDFLLHYRVTTFFPDAPLSPQLACTVRQASDDETRMLALMLVPAEGMTIGCSNSVYP